MYVHLWADKVQTDMFQIQTDRTDTDRLQTDSPQRDRVQTVSVQTERVQTISFCIDKVQTDRVQTDRVQRGSARTGFRFAGCAILVGLVVTAFQSARYYKILQDITRPCQGSSYKKDDVRGPVCLRFSEQTP